MFSIFSENTTIKSWLLSDVINEPHIMRADLVSFVKGLNYQPANFGPPSEQVRTKKNDCFKIQMSS